MGVERTRDDKRRIVREGWLLFVFLLGPTWTLPLRTVLYTGSAAPMAVPRRAPGISPALSDQGSRRERQQQIKERGRGVSGRGELVAGKSTHTHTHAPLALAAMHTGLRRSHTNAHAKTAPQQPILVTVRSPMARGLYASSETPSM
jgi:hypothetical protein